MRWAATGAAGKRRDGRGGAGARPQTPPVPPAVDFPSLPCTRPAAPAQPADGLTRPGGAGTPARRAGTPARTPRPAPRIRPTPGGGTARRQPAGRAPARRETVIRATAAGRGHPFGGFLLPGGVGLQIHRGRRWRRPSARLAGRSKPVAITVIFTLPVHLRVDDGAEDDVGILVGRLLDDGRGLADFDQRQVRTAGDVDDHAARAADRGVLEQRARDRRRWRRSMARPSPSAMPVPMIARPMPDMIVLTSAKSRLISPGTRIRSEMP